MEDSQEKVIAFWGTTRSPTFRMHQLMSENSSNCLERQIYERSVKSEPSIVKLIQNKSDSTLSEPSIVKLIENQSDHLSKLTSYHLKKRAARRSRRAREPSRITLLFLRGLNKKNSMLKKFDFKRFQRLRYRSLQSSIAMLIR